MAGIRGQHNMTNCIKGPNIRKAENLWFKELVQYLQMLAALVEDPSLALHSHL